MAQWLFVAILTPRYFMSSECRRELQTFAREAERIGIKDLILPLLYVDIPGLSDESNQDEALKLVTKFQWVDWRQLRFANTGSSEYRTAVASLAQRLANANYEATSEGSRKTSITSANRLNLTSENGPSFADLRTAIDAKMKIIAQTMRLSTAELDDYAEFTTKAADELRRSNGTNARQAVFSALASNLAKPVGRMLELANEYSSQMYDIDVAVRTFISRAPGEVQRDASRKPQICSVFAEVNGVTQSARRMISSLRRLMESIERNESPSRELRPIHQRMKLSITIMIETVSVAEEWTRAIRDSPVNCTIAKTL